MHGGAGTHIADMKGLINKMPKYKKEKALHETIVKIAEECIQKYKSNKYIIVHCNYIYYRYLSYFVNLV